MSPETESDMAKEIKKRGPGRPEKKGELRITRPVGILGSVLKKVKKDHGSLTKYVNKKLIDDGYVKE